jgi:protein-disulfide isomerase
MRPENRILTIAFVLASFTTLPPLKAQAPLKAQGDDPVATVGNQTITRAELEASVAGQLEQIERQRHLLLEGAVGPLVDRRLVELEAAEHGITPDELLDAEVTAKLEKASDADVKAWFEANQSRLTPGSTLEQLGEQIRALIERDRVQALYGDYQRALKSKYDVRVLFQPLRLEIDLANATWKGNEAAPVTLVEFSDFECPACKGFNPVIDQLLQRYPDQVRVAFLQNPLRSIHPQAQGAAEASLCARDGGMFWQLHDEMFRDQRSLGREALKASARKVGLDGEVFDACLDSGKYAPTVEADVAQAASLGVSGTPSVFVNGRQVSPGRVPSLEMLANLVDEELDRESTIATP